MSEEDVEYRFTCPQCEESLRVNDPMRDALITKGCVICGSEVTATAFTRMSASDSS